MTLLDIILRFSSDLTPHQIEYRRAALLEMSAGALALEVQEFCGGEPWREFQRVEAARAAFEALGTGAEERL